MNREVAGAGERIAYDRTPSDSDNIRIHPNVNGHSATNAMDAAAEFLGLNRLHLKAG